jgi:ubiquitin C-terminal hydrolase
MSSSEEASKAWANYLRHNDSVVTDIFAGQMQSTVECLTCGHKSKSYDPFLDLSVPVPRPASEGAGGDGGGGDGGGAEGGGKPKMGGTLPARRRGNAARHKMELSKCKLSDCLDKFSATEMLDDDNLPTCDRCKKKRRCTKTLSVYRHPQVLVIHIKRFSYTTVSRDKMETDVSFPSEGLDMSGYLSWDVKDAGVGGGRPAHVHGTAPVYDLVGVCHHMGGLTGGHYTSFVDTSFGSGERKWTHFNDARVSPADVGQVGGPSAYVLFYRIRT